MEDRDDCFLLHIQVLARCYPRLRVIIELEPDVLGLLRLACDKPIQARRWEWFELLKRAVSKLVGWQAAQQELRSQSDYDLLIDLIDRLLPPDNDPPFAFKPVQPEAMRAEAEWERKAQQFRDTIRQALPVSSEQLGEEEEGTRWRSGI